MCQLGQSTINSVTWFCAMGRLSRCVRRGKTIPARSSPSSGACRRRVATTASLAWRIVAHRQPTKRRYEMSVLRVSALLSICPEIQELDLNPVKVFASGACAIDARVRVERLVPIRRGRRVEY